MGVSVSSTLAQRVPRFNMPFELGQAVMLREFQPHDVHVFESTRHRLAQSVSDLGGIGSLIHGGDPTLISRRLLGAFAPDRRIPSLAEIETVRLGLSRVARPATSPRS